VQQKASLATAYSQNYTSNQQFANRYTGGMVAFNALPQVITHLASRPLQYAINQGPAWMQKAILQKLGVTPGQGLAKLADVGIQRAMPLLAGAQLLGGSNPIPGRTNTAPPLQKGQYKEMWNPFGANFGAAPTSNFARGNKWTIGR